jgi:predicted lipoprotein with Yx(FWY)xxD motif
MTITVAGKKELAGDMIDAGGVLPVPVYSFSKGTACAAACAADFSPLYAQGSPGLAPGLPAKAGLVMRADGTEQRSWAGKALYLYSDEGFAIGPSGIAAKGNGNGAHVAGGIFTLVTP